MIPLLTLIKTIEFDALSAFSGVHFDEAGFYPQSSFKEHFFTKKEKKSKGGKFKVSWLTTATRDKDILQELGSDAEVTLAELHHFLKEAEKDNWYLAYIRDRRGELWAVYCYWRSVDGYWGVGACAVTDPLKWRAGGQIFSRDSEADDALPLVPATLPAELVINGKHYREVI